MCRNKSSRAVAVAVCCRLQPALRSPPDRQQGNGSGQGGSGQGGLDKVVLDKVVLDKVVLGRVVLGKVDRHNAVYRCPAAEGRWEGGCREEASGGLGDDDVTR
ncbi:hypothetical protein NHX12_020318 [Muraenolepis orangiensis]|uniref:Uncharacterized protein n=1 Tax=Muraenolepis orangiensis TaxID=630683 RepID=A0A9Q0IWJ4_9TELE|nr:hypothetical protein NHX12_020318 [Muraenolepis orangiensis]